MEYERSYRRSIIWFVAGVACFASLVAVPLIGDRLPVQLDWQHRPDSLRVQTLKELDYLGLRSHLSSETVQAVLTYQKETGKSLAQIIQSPGWSEKLGLDRDIFKATWYISNPFDLLPEKLQEAIRAKEIPFRSRTHVWQWCRIHKVPQQWRQALYAALIETTPHNLWRASQGQRPFTRNGEFLEPIVVDYGGGKMTVQHGHIAVDPRVIPINSEVILLVRIQGEDRILKVKATDTGGGIRGKHIDLPIQVAPGHRPFPYTRLPFSQIRNHQVTVLIPRVNPNQKV